MKLENFTRRSFLRKSSAVTASSMLMAAGLPQITYADGATGTGTSATVEWKNTGSATAPSAALSVQFYIGSAMAAHQSELFSNVKVGETVKATFTCENATRWVETSDNG